MQISAETKTALDLLHQNGFSAYLVGGCVRDFILHKTSADIDITTNALPSQILQVFSKYKVIETGLAHGTVTVCINHQHFEVTTFRIDGNYDDNRHPDKVTFTQDIYADTCRRDFTINAICYNQAEGIVDFHGGVADIQNKVIRCVGDADTRFNEDALRILRALRFSAVLGFRIQDATRQAIFKNCKLLQNISAERIYTELSKLVCGKNAGSVLKEYVQVLDIILPSFCKMQDFNQNNPHHIHDVLTHTCIVVDSTPPVLHLRLAALFHDIGKPFCYTQDKNNIGHFYGHAEKSCEIFLQLASQLKIDNHTKSTVATLIKIHDLRPEPTEKSIKKLLSKYGEQAIRDLILLKRADNKGQNITDFDNTEYFNRLLEITDQIVATSQCYTLKTLAVNGKDLIDMGITNGIQIGETLNLVLQMVIDEQIENNKQAIFKFLQNKKL